MKHLLTFIIVFFLVYATVSALNALIGIVDHAEAASRATTGALFYTAGLEMGRRERAR